MRQQGKNRQRIARSKIGSEEVRVTGPRKLVRALWEISGSVKPVT